MRAQAQKKRIIVEETIVQHDVRGYHVSYGCLLRVQIPLS